MCVITLENVNVLDGTQWSVDQLLQQANKMRLEGAF